MADRRTLAERFGVQKPAQRPANRTPLYRDPLNPTMMTATERQRAARRERLMHRLAAALDPTWGPRSYSIAATAIEALRDELDA